MRPTRRDELNLLSARQLATYGQEYVDEYGIVYVGNKKGRLERSTGTSSTEVTDAINQFATDNQAYISQQPTTGTGTTTSVNIISPLLLMGG